VLYNEGSTDAVDTNVEFKLQEIVSVKDFGAVGDGTTDDTTAFVNALAASTSIYVPVGTYKLTSNITIPANTKLYGESISGVLPCQWKHDQCNYTDQHIH
jgi:polygalacturonase